MPNTALWSCPITAMTTVRMWQEPTSGRGQRLSSTQFLCRVGSFLFPRPILSPVPEWERNFLADKTFLYSGEFAKALTCQIKQIQCTPVVRSMDAAVRSFCMWCHFLSEQNGIGVWNSEVIFCWKKTVEVISSVYCSLDLASQINELPFSGINWGPAVW